MYNVLSAASRWKMPDFLSDGNTNVLIVHRLLVKIPTCKVWPCKYMSRSWSTKFTIDPFDGKYSTSYLMAMVMFTLSLTVYELFASQKNANILNLKMKSRSKSGKCDLRHSTRNVRIHIDDFFITLATW